MKLLAILVALILSLTGASQDIARFATLLKNKDVTALDNYIDSVSSASKFHLLRWNVNREIVPGYKEKSTHIAIQNDRGRSDNYTVDLLSAGNYIYYYRLTGRRFTDTLKDYDDWKSYDVLIDSFYDASVNNRFENAFFNAYGVNIDKAGLFNEYIVYGDMCGYGAVTTLYSYMLDSLIKKRDAKTILSWLRSANTETQLYGIRGANALEQLGYDVSAEDKRIIAIIRNKKGLVYTCGGCLFSKDSIHKIIAAIDSEKGQQLVVKNSAGVPEPAYMIGTAVLVVAFSIVYVLRLKRKKSA